MATVNLELYEVLKRSLDEEAARMIAETHPATSELTTKADLKAATDSLERRIDQLEARQLRWTLGFFMPLWIAVLVMLAAIVVKL
jgi:hypothetical protein